MNSSSASRKAIYTGQRAAQGQRETIRMGSSLSPARSNASRSKSGSPNNSQLDAPDAQGR